MTEFADRKVCQTPSQFFAAARFLPALLIILILSLAGTAVPTEAATGGAGLVIAMQHGELGHQIEFTGQDLAYIVAFPHDAAVQKRFSEEDIPAAIKAYMEEDEGDRDKAAPGGMGSGRGMGASMMGSGKMGR